MKNNWLEDSLKEKLGSYGSSLDFEQAWNKLEQRRKPKTRKRFFAWWIYGVLTGFVIMGGYWYFTLDTIVSSSDISEIDKVQTVEGSKIYDIDPLVLKSTLDDSLNVFQYDERITTGPEEPKKVTLADRKSVLNTHIQLPKKDLLGSAIVNTGMLVVKKPISTRFSVLNGKSNERSMSFNHEKGVEPIDRIASSQFLVTNEKLAFRIPSIDEKNRSVDCPSIDHRKAQIMGICGGYGLVGSGKVIDEESPLDVVTAQLYFQKYLNERIYFKTGLNIDQFTNKVEEREIDSYLSSEENQVVAIYHYQDGSQEEVLETADVEVTESLDYTIYNHYKFLSIPTLIGVNLGSRKNSYFQLEAGLSTTIASKYDVKYFDMEAQNKFSQVDNLNLKTSGVISGIYGIQWNYSPRVLNSIDIYIKYQGSYQMTSLSRDAAPSLKRFSAQQFLMGFQYRLK